MDEAGTFSEEKPYRLVVEDEEKVFRLYDGENERIREWKYEESSPYDLLLSGEADKQNIFRINSGFVLSVDGEDMVFVKLEDKSVLPDGESDKEIP